MKLSPFSFFSKKTEAETPAIITTLLSLEEQTDVLVFNDITIYHHKQKYTLPLVLFHPSYGLYLFEVKSWSFQELQTATIAKEEKINDEKTVKPAENTLAYSYMQEIIKQKFNELTHHDGVPILNYLLFENISLEEYEKLPQELQEHLPKHTIIFKDMKQEDIIEKLSLNSSLEKLYNVDTTLGNLFIQYALIDNEKLFFCNKLQRKFIDTPLPKISNLVAPQKSGATHTLLLKAMVEILNNTHQKIIIIKPTTLAKDILQKELLSLVEHAIVEFDFNALEILTPQELISRHLIKLKLSPLSNEDSLVIDMKLMKKRFGIADIILCDDANLFSLEFLQYLEHIQKKKKLLFINAPIELETETVRFQQSYQSTNRNFLFYETNPLAKTMHIVASLTQEENNNEILIVSNDENRSMLYDDLHSFISTTIAQLEGDKNLINQDFTNVLLATYNDIVDIKAKYVLLLDMHEIQEEQLNYACNIATDTTYIIYDDITPTISRLKEKYENNKE